MGLRLPLLLCALALVLAASACGRSSHSDAGAANPTPHLAENEMVSYTQGASSQLSLAWTKALRVATASELNQFALRAQDTAPADWYLVQTCSFGGQGSGFWVNPVVHRVVNVGFQSAPADLPRGGCDPRAGRPPEARATGDDCADAWNAWITHAQLPFRQAASAGSVAHVGKLDGRCTVQLIKGRDTVTLMQEPSAGGWSFLESGGTPLDVNAVVRGDGTLAVQ